jgi:hypothetical protein
VSSAEGGHLPTLDLVGSRFKTLTEQRQHLHQRRFAESTALDQNSRTSGCS